MEEYVIISFFVLLGFFIAGGAIFFSNLLSFRSKEGGKKRQAYECGVDPIGTARIQFRVGYYLFALLFLIFDIEALFLFPCAKIFKSAVQGGMPGLSPTLLMIELSVFVFILYSGLIYAWKKGALEWD